MPQQLTVFDGVNLPLNDPDQDHTATPTESRLIDSIGGVVDYYGDNQRSGRKQIIPLTGSFWGETTYMVDEAGNYIVDEAGNYLIAGDATANLRSQIRALAAKQGAVGPLWRKRFDDSDTLEWKTASLLEMRWQQKVTDRLILATVQCQFETADPAWHVEDATVTDGSASDGVPLTLAVANGGEVVVRDSVLTITRSSGTITQVDIATAAASEVVNLRWTGSLGDGDALVIDCAKNTVRKNDVDAYTLARQAGHTARGWIALAMGMTIMQVTLTGGDGTVSLSHYDQLF